MKRFGSLRNAFAAIGYVSPRDCDWLDTRASWFDLLVKQATEVVDKLQTDKRLRLCVDKNDVCLARNEKREVTFLVARHSVIVLRIVFHCGGFTGIQCRRVYFRLLG